MSGVSGAHLCNPSNSGGRNQELQFLGKAGQIVLETLPQIYPPPPSKKKKNKTGLVERLRW
jgi:hypothetical protein